MTEQVMISAEADPQNERLAPARTGTLGEATSAAPPKTNRINWRLTDARGQVVLIAGYRKTLAERIHEAYGDELEPKEKELLNRAAEQFGRRISSEE